MVSIVHTNDRIIRARIEWHSDSYQAVTYKDRPFRSLMDLSNVLNISLVWCLEEDPRIAGLHMLQHVRWVEQDDEETAIREFMAEFINIYSLPKSKWTEKLVNDYIMNRPDTHSVPTLLDVTRFKRYGNGRQFMFLCHWEHGKSSVPLWMKWIQVGMLDSFQAFLEHANWNIETEYMNHYETVNDDKQEKKYARDPELTPESSDYESADDEYQSKPLFSKKRARS